MAKLHNEITINASSEKVFKTLSEMAGLEKLDPNVKKSTPLDGTTNGLGAKRKVDMIDGKNWFEEKITASSTNKSITYELTSCSFPVKSLIYTFNIDSNGNQTKVTQQMEYKMKMGLLGKLMDFLVVRKKWDGGIKEFFQGLKKQMENN